MENLSCERGLGRIHNSFEGIKAPLRLPQAMKESVLATYLIANRQAQKDEGLYTSKWCAGVTPDPNLFSSWTLQGGTLKKVQV